MGISESDYSEIKEIARRHGASHLRLFGSRAKGVATSDSDLDLLVDLAPGRDLFDLIEMKQELEAATGLSVDLVTEKSLSKYLRARIIEEARPI
ncbi:MAG: nucleotidyltransferase domain-containing protein [Desulfofustis sp.]|jgi:uncharacterized protein|nr:nucleotidyltransferase domain-containing protein [Desulfofustis sp.]